MSKQTGKGMKMYCTYCGTENVDEARFCQNCGAALEQEISINETVSDTLNEEWKEEPAPETKKKKGKAWVFAAVIIILTAVLAGAFFAGKTVKEKKVDRSEDDYQSCMAQADKYMEDLDYENAEASYLQAIAIDPKQEEPYLKLADLYLAQEEYEKAEDILRQAEKAVGTEKADSEEQKSEIIERIKQLDVIGKYTWTVEPTIEADDIYYVTDTDYYGKSRNGTKLQYMSPYAVIKKDDAMGLIDMEGTLKAELEYENISCYDGVSYLLKSIEPASREEVLEYYEYYDDEGTWDLYTLEDDEIVLAWICEGEELAGCALYWCNGLHYIDEGYGEWYVIPTVAIPVQQTEELYFYSDFEYTDSEDFPSWWTGLEGKYAICKDSQLVTDFIYDECGSSSEGLLAVCQDGKWGYVNEKGETIIPIEYDASWDKTVDQGIDTYGEKAPTEAFCYAASGGYISLVKDGKWELRDTEGNLVILPGVFEAIRPVYEGKCWVKINGKWGVIQLEEKENSEEEEKEENESIEQLSDEQLEEIGRSLGVPENLDVQYMQDEPYYWDAGGLYCTYVQILYNGEVVATATVDSFTGELIRDIWMYSGEEL